MGLLDKLIKIKREKKEDKKLTKKEKCRHIWKYEKILGFGKAMGKVYHYKKRCKLCGVSKFIPRNKENYDKLKNIKWKMSKSYRREFNKTNRKI